MDRPTDTDNRASHYRITNLGYNTKKKKDVLRYDVAVSPHEQQPILRQTYLLFSISVDA